MSDQTYHILILIGVVVCVVLLIVPYSRRRP